MGKLLVLVGPSASGKTTLAEKVLEPLGAKRVVTTTTRPQRHGEPSSAYDFVSEYVFDLLDRDGYFFEKTTYAGRKYGILRSRLEDVFDSLELGYIILDWAGAQKIRHIFGDDVTTVFVEAPMVTLAARLIKRRAETAGDLKARLSQLEDELSNKSFCDAVIYNENGKFEEACQSLTDIVKKLIDKNGV